MCNCCKNAGSPSLKHENPDLFDRSQWCPTGKVSVPYASYRIILAFIFIGGVGWHMYNSQQGAKWFIYMTDQGIFFLTLHYVLEAILVLARFSWEKRNKDPKKMYHTSYKINFFYKISWGMGTCFFTIALWISIIYWGKIGRIGENVRLICPIAGNPAPMVEWSKNGEKIDYMWERHRTGRKSLKIRNANEDDTGVFTCKGINGFGSEEVRIELIIVDPRKLPKGLNDADTIEVAPPVMTYETRASPLLHVKSVGDTFKVSCEALGSPQPEIFWFKDGQHIDEAVHYQRGKSTVEFSVLGTADAGVYTCRARNLIGEVTQNFTLEVNQPVGGTHAIVTEAGPADATVVAGEVATLQCRVKSLAPPHIKWLKRLESHEMSGENTLRVGNERYRILEANQDVSTGNDEYLNKFEIVDSALEDSGMYICFVTNSGFGALTYKSMHLTVIEKTVSSPNPIVPNSGGPNANEEPLPVLILVICLAVSVFLLLAVIVVCVIRKKRKDTQDSAPNSPETQRPFILGDHQHQIQQQQQLLQQQQQQVRLLQKPLPPTPFLQHQWSSSVHPKLSSQPLVVLTTDSGYAEHEKSKDFDLSGGNQYEVPYAHLLPVGSSTGSTSTTATSNHNNNNSRRLFLRSSDCLSSNSHPYFEAGMTSRSGPVSGFSSDHPTYVLNQHQHLQYFSDYDSQ